MEYATIIKAAVKALEQFDIKNWEANLMARNVIEATMPLIEELVLQQEAMKNAIKEIKEKEAKRALGL